MDTLPPDEDVLSPAFITKSPPLPELLAPTVKYRPPLSPEPEMPVFMCIPPELPNSDSPVIISIEPVLAPLVPLPVRILIAPLWPSSLLPDCKSILPPVCEILCPAWIWTLPPFPESESPAIKMMSPVAPN